MKVVKSDRNVGFYSSLLGIIYCAYTNIEDGVVPYIQWKNPKYLANKDDNLFDYFFDQKNVEQIYLDASAEIKENGIRSERILNSAKRNGRTFREEMSIMFKTVCKIKDEYKEIIDELCKELELDGKIGVHIRRTDRFIGGKGLIYAGPKTDTIVNHLKERNVDNFYIATDCQETFERVTNEFKCKSFATIRSTKTKGIHYSNEISEKNKEMARECFLEGMLLSKCKFLYRMTSNFTIFSLIVNPEIDFEDLSASYEDEIKEDYNLSSIFTEKFLML